MKLHNASLIQLASNIRAFIKAMNDNIFILWLYVDDLAMFCNNQPVYEYIIYKIKYVFELSENKNSKFLGMEFKKHDNGICLS